MRFSGLSDNVRRCSQHPESTLPATDGCAWPGSDGCVSPKEHRVQFGGSQKNNLKNLKPTIGIAVQMIQVYWLRSSQIIGG